MTTSKRATEAAAPTRPEDITAAVVDSFAACPDPRLRTLLESLVRHLHAFVAETQLTEAEWMTGIRFLTETGQISTGTRQEFILASDTLGISMLVDAINHEKSSGATESTIATESTVLGPFYVPESPWRANGERIARDEDGEPLFIQGRVLGTDGTPVAGATVDVWQNAANMLYAVQDPTQPPGNLRGRFRTDESGRYWLWTIRPVDYPIPSDGPVGSMLAATGRHPWRPAHIHFIVSAPGFEPLTTHIFDAESRYLTSDAVFGVKQSLAFRFQPHDPGREKAPAGIDRPWYTTDCDLVLQRDGA